MNDSLQRKNGVILSYVAIIVNTLIQLLYTPFLIRMLGQGEYGLYSLVASIIGYLTILDFGFGNAIIVYTAKYRENNEREKEEKLHGMFKMIFIILGVIAGLLGIIMYFCVDNIFSRTMSTSELYKMKYMVLILSFNLFLTFSFNIYSSIISAYEKFTFQKIMSIISALLKPMLMIPLLFFGFKSITMTLIITLVNILIVYSNYYYCKNKLKVSTKFKGFDKVLFKTILGYSIWIFLGIVVDKINWSVDQFVLGAVSGTVAVSIYSIASTINQLFINLSTAVSGVFLPKMSKLVARKASNLELSNEFIKVGRIQYYIVFFMCSSLVLFGKEFITLWAGENYKESYYVALFLIIPICIPLIQNLGLSIMQALNKYKFKSISTFIMAIFNIIISYFLAIKYGPVGCAAGTALSLIICNIFLINIYYARELKLNIKGFWLEIIKMSLAFFIPVTIIIILNHFIVFNGIWNIIMFGFIYSVLYFLISIMLIMNDYEKRILNNIIMKVKK